jgi:hypothetical protein
MLTISIRTVIMLLYLLRIYESVCVCAKGRTNVQL